MTALRYKPEPDCVACEYGDGLAVLNIKSNMYFSLDPVGATVWDALGDGATLAQLVSAVTQEFDVAPEVCQPDVEAFLDALRRAELIGSVP